KGNGPRRSQKVGGVVAGRDFEALHVDLATIELRTDGAAAAGRCRAGAEKVRIVVEETDGLEVERADSVSESGLVVDRPFRIGGGAGAGSDESTMHATDDLPLVVE